MGNENEFAEAAQAVLRLTERPDNETLLMLYALYKQGSEGDVSGKRPGMLDIKGRKKFDAWSAQKGMSKETAQLAYVHLVKELSGK